MVHLKLVCVFKVNPRVLCMAPPTLLLPHTLIKGFFPSYFTISQPFAKLFSTETSFSLSKSSATRLSSLAYFYSNHFSQYYILRVVFFRVLLKSLPSIEAFVNLNSLVLKYLDFLLPLIELAVDLLRLTVTHLLIQRVYPCIPLSLLPEFMSYWSQ